MPEKQILEKSYTINQTDSINCIIRQYKSEFHTMPSIRTSCPPPECYQIFLNWSGTTDLVTLLQNALRHVSFLFFFFNTKCFTGRMNARDTKKQQEIQRKKNRKTEKYSGIAIKHSHAYSELNCVNPRHPVRCWLEESFKRTAALPFSVKTHAKRTEVHPPPSSKHYSTLLLLALMKCFPIEPE